MSICFYAHSFPKTGKANYRDSRTGNPPNINPPPLPPKPFSVFPNICIAGPGRVRRQCPYFACMIVPYRPPFCTYRSRKSGEIKLTFRRRGSCRSGTESRRLIGWLAGLPATHWLVWRQAKHDLDFPWICR